MAGLAGHPGHGMDNQGGKRAGQGSPWSVFFLFPPLLHLLHLLHFPYLPVFTALTTLLPILHFLLHSLHFLTCSPPVSCASRCRAERLRRAFQEGGVCFSVSPPSYTSYTPAMSDSEETAGVEGVDVG